MKRYLYLILFAIVLIAPFVLRLAVTRGKTTLDAAGNGGANGGPVGRLVIVTPHNGATTVATAARGTEIFLANLQRRLSNLPYQNRIDVASLA